MGTRQTHTFDHPIAAVWSMFGDVDAHVAKFEGMGHRDIEVLEFAADEEDVLVKIRRVVELDLPGFAKRVMKPVNTVTSVDQWEDRGDGTYGGTFTVDAKGAPVDVKGTTRLTPDGDERTTYEISVDIKVNVPIIGGKLADFAKGDIERQIREEFAAGDTWLAAH